MNGAQIRKKFQNKYPGTQDALVKFADSHYHNEIVTLIRPLRDAAFILVEIIPDSPELVKAINHLHIAREKIIHQYIQTTDFVARVSNRPTSLEDAPPPISE